MILHAIHFRVFFKHFYFFIQAECWLSALETTMRCTVRKEIQEAVAAYEDKPRDQWLFDYPAQVCSCKVCRFTILTL